MDNYQAGTDKLGTDRISLKYCITSLCTQHHTLIFNSHIYNLLPSAVSTEKNNFIGLGNPIQFHQQIFHSRVVTAE